MPGTSCIAMAAVDDTAALATTTCFTPARALGISAQTKEAMGTRASVRACPRLLNDSYVRGCHRECEDSHIWRDQVGEGGGREVFVCSCEHT